MRYTTIKVILFLFLLFLTTSCAQIDTISSVNHLNLLMKSKTLIEMCLLLISQSNLYHGQVISRLYYSYYHLARLINMNISHDKASHSKTWKSMPKIIRDFGFKMKHLREKYDYDPIPSNFFPKEDFNIILENKPSAELLINEVDETLDFCSLITDDDIKEFRLILNDIRNKHNNLLAEIEKNVAL